MGEPVRAYDHSDKAGNQGDVVKHVLLARVLELLCPVPGLFIYAETHAGRSRYSLRPSGEWQRGVGRLLSKSRADKDPAEASRGDLRVEEQELRAFTRLQSGHVVGAAKEYLGSSRIARDLLRERGQDYLMELWDVDDAVTSELREAYSDDARVRIHAGDGYTGVTSLPHTSFVLIDPPDIEATRVLPLASTLAAAGRTFVCWTPLRSRARGGKGEGALEAATSSDFLSHATDAGYGVTRVRWGSWGERTPGCQLTVSPDIGGAADRCVAQVATVMGWHYGNRV